VSAWDDDPADAPPPDARLHEIEVNGERFLVVSYPLRELVAGKLSATEAEVALLAMNGLSNAQIAETRGTSVRTVANQMASVLRKLGVASRRQLVSVLLGDGTNSLPS
jgi:DNA-binding CsgD family transcriptional regulator